jgi:predicted DNA-binding transcriptional regulator YafY
MPTRNVRDVLARHWAILRIIPREPHAISTAALHDQLAIEGFICSRRTVERDLNQLESFGFGFTCDDTAVPNLWFWLKEASINLPVMSVTDALLLCMVNDYLIPILPPKLLSALEPQFKCAKNMLESISKTNPIGTWSDKVISIPAMQRLIPPNVASGVMEEVASGLIYERQLSIHYRSRSTGITSELILNPLGLIQRGLVFYLIATSWEYKDLRRYALHRMEKVKVLDSSIIKLPNFNLKAYIEEGYGDFGKGNKLQLVLLVSPSLAEHLSECQLDINQIIEEAKDSSGWSLIRATVADTPQLDWWLRGLGNEVKLVSKRLII